MGHGQVDASSRLHEARQEAREVSKELHAAKRSGEQLQADLKACRSGLVQEQAKTADLRRAATETNRNTWSYLACRIGQWVPIWQSLIGSPGAQQLLRGVHAAPFVN
jgi:hypothetical protein